jgi:hypothetical protein
MMGQQKFQKTPPRGDAFDDRVDAELASSVAALLGIDSGRALYEVRHGGLCSLGKANRARRRRLRELTEAEKERLAREDARDDEPLRYELRKQGVSKMSTQVDDEDDDDRDDDWNDAIDALQAKAEELRKAQPHLSKEQSFAKAFESNPDLARRERRASMVRLGAAYPIRADDRTAQVGGQGALDTTGESDGGALAELVRLAEELRAKNPGMSTAQAFARIYETHAQLAKAERRHAYAKLYRRVA